MSDDHEPPVPFASWSAAGTPIVEIGWNDIPARCFPWPELWFGQLAHPHRVANETCPEEHVCIGRWTWRHYLEKKYGKENVEKVTPSYLTAREVYGILPYLDERSPPAPSDWCAHHIPDPEPAPEHLAAWQRMYEWHCNGSCKVLHDG